MKAITIVMSTLIFLSCQVYDQDRIICGRVIDEELNPLYMLRIRTANNINLAETDSAGRFKIYLPLHTDTLFFWYLGYEKATIRLNADCDTIEVVMLARPTYDFLSLNKVNRLRLKQFKTIPSIHLKAYNKGIFKTVTPNYDRTFESYQNGPFQVP